MRPRLYSPLKRGLGGFALLPLHHPYLFLRQPIKLIHKLVNLIIRDFDLSFDWFFLAVEVRGVELLMQFEHSVRKPDKRAVLLLFVGIGKVDCANGKSGKLFYLKLRKNLSLEFIK